uniref:Putative ovule protein n=1 Tax=Solanum chacoense TaxID=4108 RepID=A0A0V0GTY6_SOLCH
MRIQKQQSSSNKTQIKKVNWFLGPFLKKLKDRNSDKNGEKSFSCSCNNSRVNSEIDEGKLIDLENYSNYGDFGSSPLSPF